MSYTHFVIVKSKIIDHRYCKKYINNEKVLNIMRITKMRHRGTKWENAVSEMVPIELFNSGFPRTFNI